MGQKKEECVLCVPLCLRTQLLIYIESDAEEISCHHVCHCSSRSVCLCVRKRLCFLPISFRGLEAFMT